MTDLVLGYSSEFLPIRVILPDFEDGRLVRSLQYIHFTVLQDPQRRLPAVTGVNIDGAMLRDIERGEHWHLDTRISASEQAGPEIYANNDLDRGHQVRRRDPVWGDLATATAANQATFVYTNCAPQAGEFNQSAELWGGLENHVLDYAQVYKQKISVFTGPVLADDDPPYRGIQIPRLFWKIAAWAEEHEDGSFHLAAAGFVLDQTPELDDIDLRKAQADLAGNSPPLGPFKTYQVSIRDIEALTNLGLADLMVADQFGFVLSTRDAAPRDTWQELRSLDDIRLNKPA
ncbi:DNA/RNA endonuclease [Subtercola boreus]|uniref:DNA/RNA endonuclease n=1 Tax=Subtercola boreus TaxID=120213 RepID=A0A3E0W0Z0_9MICO|nr:DNA/RNA non-specific endonuclease [Subtercola boreus]RFA15816.1 DNA/RNA endonuclease [Subtercola boreus]